MQAAHAAGWVWGMHEDLECYMRSTIFFLASRKYQPRRLLAACLLLQARNVFLAMTLTILSGRAHVWAAKRCQLMTWTVFLCLDIIRLVLHRHFMKAGALALLDFADPAAQCEPCNMACLYARRCYKHISCKFWRVMCACVILFFNFIRLLFVMNLEKQCLRLRTT